MLVNRLDSLLPFVCVDFDEVIHQKSVVSHFVGLLSFYLVVDYRSAVKPRLEALFSDFPSNTAGRSCVTFLSQ